MNRKVCFALGGAVVSTCVLSSPALAQGFDWGADCDSGDGSFQQQIAHQSVVTVGDIPVNKGAVRIELDSQADVDVQLIDKESGTEIIAWPSGLLNDGSQGCGYFGGIEYCYSGYNGDQTASGLGKEWIEIRGATNRPLEMRAFGYAAGFATVKYSWEALSTCNEIGSGSFSQAMAHQAVNDIGVIPAGKVNVDIALEALADLDIQLYDGETALVQWPNGLLAGAGAQSLEYRGMSIEWSGYNGDGSGLGNEYIRVRGEVSTDLTMKAFAYQAGTAAVAYEWGVGVGDECRSGPCDAGLECKGVGAVPECHTEQWCESPETANQDCANLGEGPWTCSGEFSCELIGEPPVDEDTVIAMITEDATRFCAEPGHLETALSHFEYWHMGDGNVAIYPPADLAEELADVLIDGALVLAMVEVEDVTECGELVSDSETGAELGAKATVHEKMICQEALAQDVEDLACHESTTIVNDHEKYSTNKRFAYSTCVASESVEDTCKDWKKVIRTDTYYTGPACTTKHAAPNDKKDTYAMSCL